MAMISPKKLIHANIWPILHALSVVSKLLDYQNRILPIVILHFLLFPLARGFEGALRVSSTPALWIFFTKTQTLESVFRWINKYFLISKIVFCFNLNLRLGFCNLWELNSCLYFKEILPRGLGKVQMFKRQKDFSSVFAVWLRAKYWVPRCHS